MIGLVKTISHLHKIKASDWSVIKLKASDYYRDTEHRIHQVTASSRPGQTGREKWINNQPGPEPEQRGRDEKIARIRIICIHILTVEL